MDDERSKRILLVTELAMLWDDFRIPRHEVARECGISESNFSHMVSGRRPVALAREYNRIMETITAMRESQDEVV